MQETTGQLISKELLQKSKKILFVTHLAIGDFVYLQSFFKTFSQYYPDIKIDLWIDEVRRTRCFWRWNHLKNYSLYDWINNCGLFNIVYNQTYSPATYKKSLQQAQKEQYPIVVSLGIIRPHQYARLARQISPKGFVVAVKNPTKPWNILKNKAYKNVDKTFLDPAHYDHISDLYALWCKQLFGIDIEQSVRAPRIDIPIKWVIYAKLRFLKYGLDKKNNNFGKVFFVNAFAKDKKRNWPLRSLAHFIGAIKRSDEWNDISFIVNAPPGNYVHVKRLFDDLGFKNVIIFSAQQSFFQLPAIMSCCDLVVTVETAVMHLANAVGVPVIALMRQKNPEWAPYDKKNSIVITTKKRSEWINAIAWQHVVDVTVKVAKERLS
ncbi:MAG: glycosyltransferase family 9 protein [bacterium]